MPLTAESVVFGIEHLDCLADADLIAFDSETTGLQPTLGGLRLLQLGAPKRPVVVIDCWELDHDDWLKLRSFFAVERTYLAHNAVFDIGWLQEHAIHLAGKVRCTMLASKLLTNGIPNLKHGLGVVVERYLQRELSKELQASDWSAPQLSREQLAYAAADVQALLDLHDVLGERLQVARLLNAWALECRCLPAMAQMQRVGLPFNRQQLEELRESLEGDIATYGERFVVELDAALPEEHKLPRDEDGKFNLRAKATGAVRLGTKRLAGFNLNSPKQLVAKLTVLLGTTPCDKDGKPSASRQALRAYAADHAVIQTYLQWKRAEKRRQMVVSMLEHQQPDGFIRASYMQMGAETSRMSCLKPNLQQVPRDKAFRLAAEAPAGWTFVCADFGQMELRLAAAISNDELMTQAFKRNEDLHTLTAKAVYGGSAFDEADDAMRKYMRQVAKACFSGDTELLTPTGWVRLDAYNGQDVAQYVLPAGVSLNRTIKKPGPGYVSGRAAKWDGNCGTLTFTKPEAYQSFYSEDVWHCEDRNTAIIATGNHNILYVDAYGNAHKRPLGDVVSPRTFIAAGYLSRPEHGLSDAETRVLAMVVADGSFKHQRGHVSFGFSKRRKIHRCSELLNSAGIPFRKAIHSNGDNGPTTFFDVLESDISWVRFYVDEDKRLDMANCLCLDALVYLEEAQYWDGYPVEGASRDRIHVTTVVKQSADVMQAMAVTSGVPCTVSAELSPRYSTGALFRVSYAFGTTPTWRASWEPRKAEGQTVHCVQVESGLLLIRKNGKVCVQGNCNFGLLYGSGAKGLREYAGAMGITMSLDEAQQIRDTFHTTYQGIDLWQRANAQAADKSHGDKWAEVRIPVSEMRRFLPGEMNRVTVRCNTPVQGSGAAILKCALGKLWPLLYEAGEDQARLAAVIHDEVLCLVREGLEAEWCGKLQRCMEDAESLWLGDIPALAEANHGKSWADAK